MAKYSRILVALDLHGDNQQVLDQATDMAASPGAELFLIHVNEPLAVAYAADGMSWSEQVITLEASIRKDAEQRLKEVATRLGVDDDHCITAEGRPSTEIHRVVEDKSIDLIVMGTHGQSGLKLLLGSTANSVLHGVSCDVLAIRIKD
jgi:universal stress protein A